MSKAVPREAVATAVRLLRNARHPVALTGAGISVESGVQPFRGPGGLWSEIDPEAFAHINAFMKDPVKVWKGLLLRLGAALAAARPNPGHLGLAQLAEMGKCRTVITQNIDGLHQAAGSCDVVEFHGNFKRLYCIDCGQDAPSNVVDPHALPPQCACGGLLRPDIVFYGELIPSDLLGRAHRAVMDCDVMLVVGTSATVQPAAALPVTARSNGARIIEINPERTPLSDTISDLVIQGSAGPVMAALVDAMAEMA